MFRLFVWLIPDSLVSFFDYETLFITDRPREIWGGSNDVCLNLEL